MYRNPVCSWALYTKIQYPLTRMLLSISYWIFSGIYIMSLMSITDFGTCMSVFMSISYCGISWARSYRYTVYVPKSSMLMSTLVYIPKYSIRLRIPIWECYWILIHIWACSWDTKRRYAHAYICTCTKIQYAHGHHPIYQMMQYPYELACSWVCYSILVHIMQRAHVHTGFLYVYERAYLSIPSFVPHQYGHTCTKFQYAYGHPQRGTLVWSKIQYPHKNACPSVCYWILVHAYMTVLMRYQNKVCSCTLIDVPKWCKVNDKVTVNIP